MSKLGRGPLVDASYKISKLWTSWFRKRKFKNIFLYISICPGAGQFDPGGYDLSKLGRGPLVNATCTRPDNSEEEDFLSFYYVKMVCPRAGPI